MHVKSGAVQSWAAHLLLRDVAGPVVGAKPGPSGLHLALGLLRGLLPLELAQLQDGHRQAQADGDEAGARDACLGNTRARGASIPSKVPAALKTI